MAITRVKSWVAGEALTANDLNNEINNITNNVIAEPIVLTQQFDANGQLLILDADADTLLDASTDDVVDVTIANADDFRFSANTFQALAGSNIEVVSGNMTVTAGNLVMTNGAATLAVEDSRTNTVAAPVTIQATTSGSAAAGIGTGVVFKAKSADENPSNFGQIEAVATDVTAGSEDTCFQFLTRVAGAALAATYRFIATTTNKAILTHALTADRTYTFPDASGTFLLDNVGTGTIRTSTGSATVSSTSTGSSTTVTSNATMNDYSFFPSLTYNTSGSWSGAGDWAANGAVADPSNTTGRVQISSTSNGDGVSQGNSSTTTLRWRYVTASDMPEMWVAFDAAGKIVASWASDDPTPDGEPGIFVKGCTSVRLTAQDLEQFAVLSSRASEAQALIRDKKWRIQHQAYRALQLLTNDQAPSRWLLENCAINPASKRLTAKI